MVINQSMQKKNMASSDMPLSPHLTIYRPQITSILSITHRATGLYLYLGFLVVVWRLVLFVYVDDIGILWSVFDTQIGILLLCLWTWSLFYHTFNGIRHLFWDIGKGLDIQMVNATGILVLLCSVASNFAVWYYCYY